ncbi:hypothetical protein AVEN_95834-1 [Araneus ventricosus]|uniref:Retrotransposon gag domain-containing protein n=2 Tax=Araneus ventricosus TaxID=182803 RepID=A0A4Y2P2F9_ARAVE|nr:hypothetical protein AVEN_95834-1 [Araneus ventricosus]
MVPCQKSLTLCFESVILSYGLKSAKSYIRLHHPRDNALKFLIGDPIASKENDFDNLAELLIKTFEKKQSFQEIHRQFSAISQKQNQSVKDLANEASMVADKYVTVENTNQNCDLILKENLKLTKFLEALKPDISLEVKKFGPKDLKSALAHAINIESALEQSCDNSTNNISSVDIHNILKENLIKDQLIADLSKKINNLTRGNVINNIKRDTTSASHEGDTQNKITCHICSEPHWTTDSWYYPRGNQSRNPRPWRRYNSHESQNVHPYRVSL